MDGIGSVDRTRPVVGQTAAPVREGSAEAKDTQAQDKVAIQAGPPPSLESLRTEVRNALDKLDEVQSGFSRCGRALSKENEELNAAQDKVARLLRDGEYRRYDATEGYLSPRHGYDPYPGHHGPFPPGPFPPGHHDGSHEGDGSLERRTLQLAEECINTAGENLEGAIRNTRYGSENAQDARHKIDSVLGHVEGSNPDAALDDTREGKRKSQSSEEERSGAQDRLEKLRVNLRSARENLNLYLERLSFWHSGDREYLAKDALRALDNALSCNDTAQGAADDLRRSIGRAGEAIDDVQGELQKSR